MSYPNELTSQLKAGDSVVKFVQLKYGWIALTEERILYNSRVYYEESKTKSNETGNFPISKVSSIMVKERKAGCLGSKSTVIELNIQGAKYTLDAGKTADQVRSLIAEFNART